QADMAPYGHLHQIVDPYMLADPRMIADGEMPWIFHTDRRLNDHTNADVGAKEAEQGNLESGRQIPSTFQKQGVDDSPEDDLQTGIARLVIALSILVKTCSHAVPGLLRFAGSD